MKPLFLIACLFSGLSAFSQEAVINDIKGCANLYWLKDDLVKQIQKEKDTINYFHDEELVIFYNRTRTEDLHPNTFYIINHGFNKLISINILYAMIESSNGKKNKDTLITSPGFLIPVFHQDSLARGSYSAFRIDFINPRYKQHTIKSFFIEIKYYGKIIQRWFLKEMESGSPVPKKDNKQITI